MKRYYFDGHDLDKNYSTLWNGFLELESNTIKLINHYDCQTNNELEDLISEICDINFYIYIIDLKIYISLCQDSKYYYHQFEKDIKKVIIEIENKFNVTINCGEFNATEVRHQGDQYKYTITKNENSNIILKKKVLNWDSYESKSKKIKINDITKKISNLKIN